MIHTESLTKIFDDYVAVNHIAIDVQPGQVLALLGQNGAGKTTTIRMLASVLTPSNGWAKIAGYDVVTESKQVRSSIGVLTEQHGLYLRMLGVEYLDFFGKIYGLETNKRKKRISDLLDFFGLLEYSKIPIGQYSKGMRQKLSLARTLLHEPPVLLLDEPTSAMDPESSRLVRQAIASLRSNNRTILICTHNLVEAEMLSDKIAIIFKGRILIQGTVEELRKLMFGPSQYKAILRGNLKDLLKTLPPGVEFIKEENGNPIFCVDDPEKTNPLLLRQLINSGVEVVCFQEITHTLEDVYLAAMENSVKYLA